MPLFFLKACTTYAVMICDPSGVGNFFYLVYLKTYDAPGIKMYFKNPELNYYHSDAVGIKLNSFQQVPS